MHFLAQLFAQKSFKVCEISHQYPFILKNCISFDHFFKYNVRLYERMHRYNEFNIKYRGPKNNTFFFSKLSNFVVLRASPLKIQN